MPTPRPENPEFFTVAEVASRLRVSKMTIYRLVETGELAHVPIRSRNIRIRASAIEDYLNRASDIVSAS